LSEFVRHWKLKTADLPMETRRYLYFSRKGFYQDHRGYHHFINLFQQRKDNFTISI